MNLPTGRRAVIWVTGAVLAYGVFNALLARLTLPGAPIIALRPQIVIPLCFGMVFGPLAGFVVGALGNGVGDLLAGLGVTFWDWHIGNGLIGMIAGVIARLRVPVRTARVLTSVLLAVVLANAVGLCCGILIDGLALGRYSAGEAFLSWYLPAVVTNVILGVVLVPLGLWLVGMLALTVETRTGLALVWTVVGAVLCVTAAVTWRVAHLHTGSAGDTLAGSAEVTLAAMRWAGGLALLVLLPVLGVAMVLTRRVTAPLAELAERARELEAGRHDPAAMTGLIARSDEVGELAHAFAIMAESVQRREQSLRREISELRIEIDRDRQRTEVKRIVESEYFRELESKTRALRERRERGKAPRPEGGQ